MTLKNVLEEICAEEYALPENAPRHRFSLKHRRAVNDVLYSEKEKRRMTVKRRVLMIAAAAAALAVITGAAASFYHYNGFAFHKLKNDFVEGYIMLVENRDNCPQTIEKLIYDDNMPKDFTFLKTVSYDGEFIENQYISKERENIFGKKVAVVNIEQCTKRSFVNPITDDFIVSPIEVKGCKGFTITSKGEVHGMNVVIWDSGDYIHVVNGTITLDELLEIAENMIELT